MVVTTLKYSLNNNSMSAERYQTFLNPRIIFLNYDQLNAEPAYDMLFNFMLYVSRLLSRKRPCMSGNVAYQAVNSIIMDTVLTKVKTHRTAPKQVINHTRSTGLNLPRLSFKAFSVCNRTITTKR